MAGLQERLATELEGRYLVQRELGEGGMAIVYLAEDLRHRRPVAIKVLRPEVAKALGSERFLQEIEIAARLNHPRIIPLLDSGAGHGLLYYVMPFIEGESLRARLDRDRQLPVEDAVAIASQVARALVHAHDRGVIHRDVKPGNVLLVGGEAVVADFGIARALETAGGDRLTETGVAVGTPAYMSPEQASADRDPDARSDVYSLGCILYEMLTGEPPFTGSTARVVTARKLSQPPPDPAVVRETVSPGLSRIVVRALAPSAADRYATAGDLGDALAQVRPGQAMGTVAEGRGERGSLLGRRAGRLVGAAASVVLVALALWGWLRPLPDGSAARATRVPIMLPAEVNVTRDVAAGSALAVSPDGRTVVIVGTDAEGRRLYRRTQDELQAVPIAGTEGAGSPFFSPDGLWIGFFAEGRLRRVPVDGGAPADIATAPDVPMGASWGRSDRIVFSHGYRAPLQVVSAEGGEPEALTTVDTEAGERSHRHPTFLPDGRTVLFAVVGPDLLEIHALDVVTGERTGPLTQGIAPRYAGGHLFLGRGSTLFGAPFSPDAVALEGPVVPLVERVTNELGIAAVHYAVSEGGTIAYVRGSEGGGLVLRSPDGTERTLPDLGWTGRPRFSPDGARVAATIGEDVWVYDLASSDDPVRFTFEGGDAPVWTPDGSHISYGIEGEGLFTKPVDGGGERQQLLAHDQWLQPIGWTPDGGVLAFAMYTEEGESCLGMLAGGQYRCILNLRHWWSRLSPDGRWLAYETQESGRAEVSVRSFPEGDVRYQITQRGGSGPAWGADGLELYYRSGARLMAARIDTAGGVRVRSRRVVLEPFRVQRPDDYDVHPDGTLALVRPLQGPEAGDVVAVFNWFGELRSLTAR